MAKKKSPFVCRHCGVTVIHWSKGQGMIWKHATGGGLKACSRPEPIEREKWEAAMDHLFSRRPPSAK